MIGYFASLRPSEVLRLEVNDFLLNEHGFLDTDINGYGRLFLPASKSKQARFPSPIWEGTESERGTLIVPALVQQINLYLEKLLYDNQKETGKGYLFRPKVTMFDLNTRILYPTTMGN
jgi:hypothetical protein